MAPKIVVVCGPTATGKTALAVELAQRLNGEVVSADSMQVYRGMDIGTAKPTQAERRGVPHHMLDVADPQENYSVARYVQDAIPVVDGILARGKLPVVAGGTGLYIDALTAGRVFAPYTPDSGLREDLTRQAREQGLPCLFSQLESVDPQAAKRIHPNDEKRILRALEVWYATGKTITQHNLETQTMPRRYAPLTIGLNFSRREDLRRRIDWRVDEMMNNGLEAEVRALLAKGIPDQCTAMQAIGYKELSAALRNDLPLTDAVEEIKLRSRQYAKRQLTWFRRNKSVEWHVWEGIPDFSAAAEHSTKFLLAHGIG